MFATLVLFLLMLTPPAAPAAQEQKFTPVEGAGFQAKQEAAATRAATMSPQTPFWTAYSFDVRPGIATDFEWVGDDGSHINIDGSSMMFFDGKFETRNLGVFLLRANDVRNAITRLEVYNLERRREYSGYRVFWAGRVSNDESLAFLRGLIDNSRPEDLASQATRALALHDDSRVPSILESIIRSSTIPRVRSQAVRWLGHTTLTSASAPPILFELARNSNEHSDIRRSAISALGARKDAEVLSVLQGLYDNVSDTNLKRSVLSAIGHNVNRQAAAAFIINIADRDPDRDMRKRAIELLGDIAGEQALASLTERLNQPSAETELQIQVVRSLARRPASESVPLLINVARTHSKPEVRKQAFLMLGRTGDPKAVSFLRDVLLK